MRIIHNNGKSTYLHLEIPTGTGTLSSGDFVFREVPSGAIDGANATYTTAFSFIPETLEVYYNGVLQKPVNDYIASGGNTITFTFSPESPDTIMVNYIKA